MFSAYMSKQSYTLNYKYCILVFSFSFFDKIEINNIKKNKNKTVEHIACVNP